MPPTAADEFYETLVGTSGNDRIDESSAPSNYVIDFDLSQGGEDTVFGGQGLNIFDMGAAFSAGDALTGLENDEVTLNGDYSYGLKLTNKSMVGIGQMYCYGSGNVYCLTMADGNVGPGKSLSVTSEGVLHLDASAEEDGDYHVTLDKPGSSFIGGAGDDVVDFYGNNVFTKTDRLDGGAGTNYLNISGQTDIILTNKVFHDFQYINYGYGITTLKIQNNILSSGDVLHIGTSDDTGGAQIDLNFDGHRENVGGFDVVAPLSGDLNVAVGGKGDDHFSYFETVTGGRGGDTITVFNFSIYASVRDSTPADPDHYTTLSDSARIDLHLIDADTKTAGDQAFHIVSALTGHAGELTMQYNATTKTTTLLADVNGDGKADMEIIFDGDHHTYTHFIL